MEKRTKKKEGQKEPEASRLKVSNILKDALHLEYKGKAFYESVVKRTQVQSVKDLLKLLIGEEGKHIALLKEKYGHQLKEKKLEIPAAQKAGQLSLDKILTGKIARKIARAGYEAAVISAALELEKSAVHYYSTHVSEVESEEEKKLFQWLAGWEKDHMRLLAEMGKELRERIWFDHQFWPLG